MLVLGGTGVFGGRLCRLLANDPLIDLTIGARDGARVATLAADLKRIHTCSLLPEDLEVGGFIFDVRSGALTPA